MATVQDERAALMAMQAAVGERPAIALEWPELFACLARAFLPPPAQLTGDAWCEALAGDLADLAPPLDLDVTAAVAALRAAARSKTARDSWLVAYSHLFLVPPVHVPLNAGIYLEGGLAGVSAQMLAQCYATAGFAQREDFRDLPDHVALQLEFVSALLARGEAGDADAFAMCNEFIAEFVAHWAQPLHHACKSAAATEESAVVYAALAALLIAALERLTPPALRLRAA